jgi:hypothetical protein
MCHAELRRADQPFVFGVGLGVGLGVVVVPGEGVGLVPGGVVGAFGAFGSTGAFGSVGTPGCCVGSVGDAGGAVSAGGGADSWVGAGMAWLLDGVVSASSWEPPQPNSGAAVRVSVRASAFFMRLCLTRRAQSSNRNPTSRHCRLTFIAHCSLHATELLW